MIFLFRLRRKIDKNRINYQKKKSYTINENLLVYVFLISFFFLINCELREKKKQKNKRNNKKFITFYEAFIKVNMQRTVYAILLTSFNLT